MQILYIHMGEKYIWRNSNLNNLNLKIAITMDDHYHKETTQMPSTGEWLGTYDTILYQSPWGFVGFHIFHKQNTFSQIVKTNCLRRISIK